MYNWIWKQVVRALEGDVSVSLDDLGEGVKPGTSSMFGINASDSIEYDAAAYSADMRRFRELALESSDYGQSTDEYGLNPCATSSDVSSAYGSRQPPLPTSSTLPDPPT